MEIRSVINRLPNDHFFDNISYQVSRSSSSVIFNHSESGGAGSSKDYVNKLRIALKELKETIAGLELVAKSLKSEEDRISDILDEANQICAILYTCIKKASMKI